MCLSNPHRGVLLVSRLEKDALESQTMRGCTLPSPCAVPGQQHGRHLRRCAHTTSYFDERADKIADHRTGESISQEFDRHYLGRVAAAANQTLIEVGRVVW